MMNHDLSRLLIPISLILPLIAGCDTGDTPSTENGEDGGPDLDGGTDAGVCPDEGDTLPTGGPCRFFVDRDANPQCATGRSWAKAFTSIQEGIDAAAAAIVANETCDVWVAGGEYDLPDCSASPAMDTEWTLPDLGGIGLKPGVSVYGGFAGVEGELAQRDLASNPTTIRNRVAGATGAVLDGVTINAGNAWDGCNIGEDVPPGPTGLYNSNESPVIRNCVFTGNISMEGGAVRNTNSSPLFENCIFFNNTARFFPFASRGDQGGAVFNQKSNPTFVNCTFYDNHLKFFDDNLGEYKDSEHSASGAMYSDEDSAPIIVNTIIWKNSIEGPATITYSNVEGGWPGEGNLNADPRFMNAAGGNYHLLPDSPCIDAADGTRSPATDMDGTPRVDDPNTDNLGIGPPWADMGAYEVQP